MGSMKQLKYLNLSHSYFYGILPDELGNLTNLQVLDLSWSGATVNSFKWASGLRELWYLDMTQTFLSQADDWMESLIGPLPSLRVLRLPSTQLGAPHPSHKTHLNASLAAPPIQYLDLSQNSLDGPIPHILQSLLSLEHLDLSSNNFGAKIPLWLGQLQALKNLNLEFNAFTDIEGGLWGVLHNLCSLRILNLRKNSLQGNLLEYLDNSSSCTHYDLEILDLSHNKFISGSIPAWLGAKFRSLKSITLFHNKISGEVPESLGMLSALKNLNLSRNQLNLIPNSVGMLSSLEYLGVSDNKLNSMLPEPIGHLSNLKELHIYNNPLEGTVLSHAHFANLTSLTYLDMSNTFLQLKLPTNWIPPFQLQMLNAGTCKVNGPFPQWLRTQKNLSTLHLSHAGIYGATPKWFRNMQQLAEVDLSNNKITGPPVFPINYDHINLSNNSLSGPMSSDSNHASIHYNALTADLSNNFIPGPFPQHLDRNMPNLLVLILSNNRINGSIPKSLCKSKYIEILDLQRNDLSGTLPDCWDNATGPSFTFVSFSANKLSGTIPCGWSPYYMHLSDNILSGPIPSCLRRLQDLEILDLSDNELSGKIPDWINAGNFPVLQILRLRGNKLNGVIPTALCSLSQLQILDLGHNHFTGKIPHCLSNLTSMILPILPPVFDDVEELQVVIKGIEGSYTSTLRYLVNIDLSCNNLVGGIPDRITNLSGLVGLNLSYNQLTGIIPDSIWGLKSLESLDLSMNKIRGPIPRSMGELYSLEYLNLSYNNLSGPIPYSGQLGTLTNPSFYAGNPYLCGDPLPKKCMITNDKQPEPEGSEDKGNEDEDKEDKLQKILFDLVVLLGFVTGFWVVVGTLLLKRKWRHALFRLVDDAYDWVHVRVAVRMAKLKRK